MHVSHKVSNRNAGFSLIEVLIVTGIISFLGVVLATFQAQILSAQSHMKTSVGLDVFRRNLAALVVDTPSWQKTVQSNPSMACLLNGTQCAPGVPQNFKIFDAAGNTFYDPTSPSNGITVTGDTCSTYSSSGGNNGSGSAKASGSTCLFRMNATWVANCVPPNCAYPQVVISFQLSSSDTSINPANYSVPNIYRSAQ